jgi:hypothetical protein
MFTAGVADPGLYALKYIRKHKDTGEYGAQLLGQEEGG